MIWFATTIIIIIPALLISRSNIFASTRQVSRLALLGVVSRNSIDAYALAAFRLLEAVSFQMLVCTNRIEHAGSFD
jgi:hypothetical protein